MPGRKNIILLVDDEESLLEITSSILETEGYVAKTANSVSRAIEILNEAAPDLIVSDITMPGGSGFDFLTHVRSIPQLQHVPFVFLTAHSDMESIKTGKELGVDDYLTKPVDFYLLLSTIRGKLRRKEQLTEAFAFQTDQIKNQLFRLISHEMRTPLTSILGATELLSDSKEQLSPNEFTSFLEMLQSSSKRLTSMVDDFLTAMKIESGELVKELDIKETHINPHAMFTRILHEIESKVQLQRINIVNEIPDKMIFVNAHVQHIENILKRFVDNAVKFSSYGGRVTFSLREEPETATFIVRDEGCGIPRVKQELLFQKFQQVNREKNEQQGSGLGLFIASRLARANHADLWFESEEGKGSTFYLKVPKAKQASA